MTLSTQTDPHEHTDMHDPALSVVPRYVRGEEHVSAYMHPSHIHQTPAVHYTEHHWVPDVHHPDDINEFHDHYEQLPEPLPATEYQAPVSEASEDQAFEPPQVEWDASRYVIQLVSLFA